MSRALSLAGFEVTLIGRFWVIPEANKRRSTRRGAYSSLLITIPRPQRGNFFTRGRFFSQFVLIR